METRILTHEEIVISENIQDVEIKLNILRSKLKGIDKNSPFTDSLNRSFYGGMVGYMNKKDNARKSRELEKYIDACNTEQQLTREIQTLESKAKKSDTGNYLLRKNGLLVDSYKILNEKLNSINKMINSESIKGRKATKEELTLLSDMRKEVVKKIKARESNQSQGLLKNK